MTSNIGSDYVLENNKDKVMEEVKRTFRPEFVNRIDEIVVFNTLSKEAINKILDKIIREIDVWIDDFTPCLKDNLTGEVVNTEVIRIRRKSFLGKFNRKNGWYVNWGKIVEEYEVYALVLEGTVDIQGLVALNRNDELKAMYIAWMCTAPQNNPKMNDSPKYAGVGGHLFAIAGSESMKAGYGGAIYGYAANQQVLEHYMEKMHATHVGVLHPYQFCVFENEMQEIIKTYTYAYSGEEI